MSTRVVIEASSSRDGSNAYCFRTVYQLELTESSRWTMDGSIVSHYPCLYLPLQPEKGSPVKPGKQVHSNEPLLELPLVHCAKNPHGVKLHGSVWRVKRDITQVLQYREFGDNMLYIQSQCYTLATGLLNIFAAVPPSVAKSITGAVSRRKEAVKRAATKELSFSTCSGN